MTGSVTWETLIWVVGIIVVAGGAVAGFLLWVWKIVQALKKDFEARIDSAATKIESAAALAQLTRAEHNEYRVHAAEKFATKDGVTQAIGRMEAAVERLTTQVHDAVERLTTRLDQMLQNSRNDPPRG